MEGGEKRGVSRYLFAYIIYTGSSDRWKTAEAAMVAMHAYITCSGQFAELGPASGQSDAAWVAAMVRRWKRPASDAIVERERERERERWVERLHSIPPYTRWPWSAVLLSPQLPAEAASKQSFGGDAGRYGYGHGPTHGWWRPTQGLASHHPLPQSGSKHMLAATDKGAQVPLLQ